MGSLELNIGDIVRKPLRGDHYAISRVIPGVSSIFIQNGEITGIPGSMVGAAELIGRMSLDQLHEGMVRAMQYEDESSRDLYDRLHLQFEQGPVEYHWE